MIDKRIIAHFSARRAIIASVSGDVLIAACFALTVYSPHGNMLAYIESHGSVWLAVLATSWLCGVILLLLIGALIRQVLFDDLRAVWLERGAVIYLDKHWFSVDSAEIREIAVGTYGRFKQKGVILKLRNGCNKSIPLGLLDDSGETIVARLREAVFS